MTESTLDRRRRPTFNGVLVRALARRNLPAEGASARPKAREIVPAGRSGGDSTSTAGGGLAFDPKLLTLNPARAASSSC